MTNEIIIYQDNEQAVKLEVRIEEDTVWLTQAQMAELFNSSKQNISLHIGNIFKENELSFDSTVKEYLTVQKEGSRSVKRKIAVYNLDVIISTGYRVKSKRGTQFRIWANKVLKEYMLKGYAINNRIERLESDVHEIKSKINEIDFQIHTSLPPTQGIFFDGQVFDAYLFVAKIIKKAASSIILIDNYVDESALSILSKRADNVKAVIYTNFNSKLKLDLKKHNEQYSCIEIKHFIKSHDRFLIIDEKETYHLGASLKDLGKKWFAFSKMNFNVKDILEKLYNIT